MSNIKKAFVEIVAFLEANKDVKVSKVLDHVIELASAKTSRTEGNLSVKNTAGEVVAILDYYFKRWMPLVGDAAVEFGKKASTSTGYNSMCKEGVSAWTKQQREAKNATAQLLQNVSSGEVLPEAIPAEQAKIEETRKFVPATTLGFDTVEALSKYLVKNGVEIAA